MAKSVVVFVLSFVGIFVVDQNLKNIFLEGYRWQGEYFSLILTYNRGVAFSMLSFLQDDLKYLQVALLSGVFLYIAWHKEILKEYSLPAGMILGAGCSNLYDRFMHGGVVDYFFWHKWFNFAVFNFADVMINISVVVILFLSFRTKK